MKRRPRYATSEPLQRLQRSAERHAQAIDAAYESITRAVNDYYRKPSPWRHKEIAEKVRFVTRMERGLIRTA